jgi:hypothetical protein
MSHVDKITSPVYLFTSFTSNYGAVQPFGARWAGHVACMEKGKNSWKILIGKPEWMKYL